MTLDVVGTLSTNKQSNIQKETKNAQFQYHFLGDNKYVMGSGSNLFSGNRKKKHVIVVSEDAKSIK